MVEQLLLHKCEMRSEAFKETIYEAHLVHPGTGRTLDIRIDYRGELQVKQLTADRHTHWRTFPLDDVCKTLSREG